MILTETANVAVGTLPVGAMFLHPTTLEVLKVRAGAVNPGLYAPVPDSDVVYAVPVGSDDVIAGSYVFKADRKVTVVVETKIDLTNTGLHNTKMISVRKLTEDHIVVARNGSRFTIKPGSLYRSQFGAPGGAAQSVCTRFVLSNGQVFTMNNNCMRVRVAV